MSKEIDVVDECLRIACNASTCSVMVYNLIRKVGHGELTADNALHQMVEVCHNINEISKDASALADVLGEKEGVK